MSQESTLEARDLRLIQAIAEQGGVTRAARRLHGWTWRSVATP